MKVKTRFKKMDIFELAAGLLRPRLDRQILVSLLLLALLFVPWPQNLSARQDEQDPAQASQGQQYIQQTPEQLQQLVAPIALYPDSLVAQILAASTFPEPVVEADQWVQAHPDLKGDALAQAVDQQPWDPSIKALTAFPSVLGNMDVVSRRRLLQPRTRRDGRRPGDAPAGTASGQSSDYGAANRNVPRLDHHHRAC
jgi:uncharacterized protein DUF3300